MPGEEIALDKILKVLAENGPLTPLEISVKTLINPEDTRHQLDRLVLQGYLTRREVPNGLESEILDLTPKGKRLLAQKLGV